MATPGYLALLGLVLALEFIGTVCLF